MEILLNVDVIKSLKKEPEPTIILQTGDEITIKSSINDVMQKINAYKLGSRERSKEEKNRK